jgi:thioredoxin-like negative regulator of GroEL
MPQAKSILAAAWKQQSSDRAIRGSYVSALLLAGRSEDAAKILDETLRNNRRTSRPLVGCSWFYIRDGQYSEAQSNLDQVLFLRADSAEVRYAVARVHAARGSVLAQRQQLGEALALRPDFWTARVELANLLIRETATDSACGAPAVI